MEKTLTLTIISPDRILYQGKAESVVLPGSVGYFGVLPGHASLVAQLDFGILKMHSAGGHSMSLAIDGGFCEVKNDHIRVLTEGGEAKEDISLHHAEELLEEALQLPPGIDRENQVKKAKVRILLHQS